MISVKDRFLKYVSYDSQSDPNGKGNPSSAKQLELGRALVEEMQKMGIADAAIDKNGYVSGTIPSNLGRKAPVLGFIAHMDTSPDISGANVHPRVVENYDGGDIVLNAQRNIVMRPEEFESLRSYVGQDLIVTDGTTLLGADDKAGVAEILTMAQTLLENPQILHGEIKLGFTPDEEVGRGADLFDVAAFGADFAYTVDGGAIGELEYENFNAASAQVEIHGMNIHPGSAKNKMRNSILLGMEFHAMLPAFENPAYTEGYEGFSHLNEMQGSVELTKLSYIIRDHDKERFEEKKKRFEKIADYLNEKYGAGTVEITLKDSYYNMREQILPHFWLIEQAKEEMEKLDIAPLIVPIRGGTDGARLSFMGLPCPNLFTGGHNMHGRYEYIPVQSMEKAVQLLVALAQLGAKNLGTQSAS